MSAPPKFRGDPITGKHELVDYIAAGSKPKADWRIGTEHEKFVFDLKTLRTVSYERTVRIPDLRDGEGEEVLSRVLRPDGTPDQNWVRVRGLRQRLPTYREVAEHMAQRGELTADGQPMTAGAVERRLRDACAKVAWAIRARAAMAELEERA